MLNKKIINEDLNLENIEAFENHLENVDKNFTSFISRFESQALKNPYYIAIDSSQEDLSLDYQCCNLYSNKIAHYLSILGVSKGDLIGVCSDRTINSYLILLALLKLGATIVPLDLEYPDDRLEFIISDSKLSYVISNNLLQKQFPKHVNVINLHTFLQNLDDQNLREDNPSIAISYNDFLYIIYTSGSTGKPKGICMSQGAASEFLNWEINYYEYLKNEKVLQFSPLNFDIFFQECLTSWSKGDQLIILPKQYRKQVDSLLHFIEEEKINKIMVPYVTLAQLAEFTSVSNTYPASLKKNNKCG